MRPRQLRSHVDKRQAILQLIAKPERAARLIKPGAAPEPAAQSLIGQPAIQHEIVDENRRPHLQRAEFLIPPARELTPARSPLDRAL